MGIDYDGFKIDRLSHKGVSELEKAFHDEWKEENTRRRWVNHNEVPLDMIPDFNGRDSKVASTIIQWLGTSCGQGFIDQVKRRYDKQQDKNARK